MKKLFLLPVFILMASIFSSCEDDSTNPLPEEIGGQFMKLDIQTREMDFNNIDATAFGGVLSNPSNNVVRYELFVRRRDHLGFLTGDYVPLTTITSFPYQLAITPQMLATALGMQVSEFSNADKFIFIAYSYDANGNKSGYSNLARIIQVTDTMEQGYRFNTQLIKDPKPFDTVDPYDNHDESI